MTTFFWLLLWLSPHFFSWSRIELEPACYVQRDGAVKPLSGWAPSGILCPNTITFHRWCVEWIIKPEKVMLQPRPSWHYCTTCIQLCNLTGLGGILIRKSALGLRGWWFAPWPSFKDEHFFIKNKKKKEKPKSMQNQKKNRVEMKTIIKLIP